ncbi:MAG: 1,2-dihydroxy-3-keto-5-methylthiopentene dioxygenase [Pseudonocardiales bacterium]|jgi:hypothetical protein|nr:1,2-dihydroxy-3-keto-5-methylthiopentene dioxygenase [Pseudonocardiales bacterium]
MSQQIVRQPNGKYGVFSTVTNTIIVWEATDTEIVEFFAEQAAETARRAAQRALEHVAAGQPKKAYFQFALDWAEALELDREHDGTAWREAT